MTHAVISNDRASVAALDDEAALKNAVSTYDSIGTRLRLHLDALNRGEHPEGMTAKELLDDLKTTEKTLNSILEIRGRLATRVDKLAAAKGELDLDRARAEIEGRLARIASPG